MPTPAGQLQMLEALEKVYGAERLLDELRSDAGNERLRGRLCASGHGDDQHGCR